MFPSHQISYVQKTGDLNRLVDDLNRAIVQINRALLDIYGKANTGVFSGVATTAQALQVQPTYLDQEAVHYSGAVKNVDLNGKRFSNAGVLGVGVANASATCHIKGAIRVDTSTVVGSNPASFSVDTKPGDISSPNPVMWIAVDMSGVGGYIPCWR